MTWMVFSGALDYGCVTVRGYEFEGAVATLRSLGADQAADDLRDVRDVPEDSDRIHPDDVFEDLGVWVEWVEAHGGDPVPPGPFDPAGPHMRV